MPPLDFPASPTTGQVFQGGNGAWTWDSAKWISGNGTGFLTIISDTPPVPGTPGLLWWNSSPGSGQLYVSYNDGTSIQWVAANNPGAGGQYLPLTGGTLSGSLTLAGNAASALQAVPLQQLNSVAAGYLPLVGGTLSGPGTLNVGGTATFSGLLQSNNGLRTGGGAVNLGGYTWAQINSVFNTLANSGAMGIGWNYTQGRGETDFFISKNGGDTGGLNIYNFPDTSATPPLLMSLQSTADLLVGRNISFGSGTMLSTAALPGHIYNAGNNAIALFGGSATAQLVGGAYWNGTNYIYLQSASGLATIFNASSNGSFYWNTAPVGSPGAAAAITQRMQLDNNGVLTLSNGPLFVNNNYVQVGGNGTGSIRLTSGDATNHGYIEFRRADGTRDAYFGYFPAGQIALIMENSTVLQIQGSGGSYADNGYNWGYSGKGWNTVTAYAFWNPSDISHKTDLQDLPSCLPFIERLNPQRYRLNNDFTERRDAEHWGFVAQDVEAAFDGHEFGGHKTENGQQLISYHQLTAVLWKAVQELTAEVALLKAKL